MGRGEGMLDGGRGEGQGGDFGQGWGEGCWDRGGGVKRYFGQGIRTLDREAGIGQGRGREVRGRKKHHAPTSFWAASKRPLTEQHMSGFGGKSGRRGGSESKKKSFSPQIPPQAHAPQPPPELRQHPHTPNPHALTIFAGMLEKGNTQQPQV